MALLKPVRSGQYPMTAEFTWNFDDTIKEVGGTTVDMGKTNFAATVADVINLPPGSVVISGVLYVTTAFDAATYAVIVGDSGATNRYLATADRKGVATTNLTPTGYVNTGGLNISLGFTCADALTTGVARLVVTYVVQGKANEAVPS